MESLENPFKQYFEIVNESKDQFTFKPTDAWRKFKGTSSREPFVMLKDRDSLKITMNIEETQDLTPTWRFKNGKWVILGVSRYFGDFFDQHPLTEICPHCGERVNCECNDWCKINE